MAKKKTVTSGFGVSKREGHDSSAFYNSKLYSSLPTGGNGKKPAEPEASGTDNSRKESETNWMDKVYCQSSTDMPIPSNSVALAFTSPPYNAGKDYKDHEDDMTLDEYLDLIRKVAREVYRVLVPGGRYLVNCAALGRKPYIPIQAYFQFLHQEVGFLPMGEIIWQKGKGASGNCAWGSWMSAKSPSLRDLHEYILVFTKERFGRPDKGESTIDRDEFMAGTLSIWNIPPESAKRVGHPAPFPVELASRVINLYSYKGDVVLDPFNGSGTTCVAAKMLGRHYVGFDISPEYCEIANKRLNQVAAPTQ